MPRNRLLNPWYIISDDPGRLQPPSSSCNLTAFITHTTTLLARTAQRGNAQPPPLVQLRSKLNPKLQIAVAEQIPCTDRHRLLLNVSDRALLAESVEACHELGLGGVHLAGHVAAALAADATTDGRRLLQLLTGCGKEDGGVGDEQVKEEENDADSTSHRRLVFGVSCHGSEDLVQASNDLQATFAVLSPVLPSTSCPSDQTLGWDGFENHIRTALAMQAGRELVPVYALGGVGPSDLPRAVAAGGHGIAGIKCFWHDMNFASGDRLIYK
ncbi:hypothetical protein HDU87_008322 [Geranomyces variabilis]|uniref:Thiamine phosphate synthase/TenI domain-containing protein n=1 Tax=Geranomyces variabilis TaxID=109894 RepID=A0AAD5XPB3_9FUNG|nr:hypothetical protein HDU87_008322 [Geranomyces variabilis]